MHYTEHGFYKTEYNLRLFCLNWENHMALAHSRIHNHLERLFFPNSFTHPVGCFQVVWTSWGTDRPLQCQIQASVHPPPRPAWALAAAAPTCLIWPKKRWRTWRAALKMMRRAANSSSSSLPGAQTYSYTQPDNTLQCCSNNYEFVFLWDFW